MYFMFLIIIQWTNSSLLSRFRYPNEYIPSPESMVPPEDLPQDLYENLIEERPDLKPILGPLRKTKLRHPQMPYLRKTTVSVTSSDSDSEYEYRNEGTPIQEYDDDGSIMSRTARYTYKPEQDTNATTTSSFLSNSSRMMPFLSRKRTNNSRRWWWFSDPRYQGPVVARCYYCNAFFSDIPLQRGCHSGFDSEDWRERTRARIHRTKCYYYDSYKVTGKIESYDWRGYIYEKDRGLKRAYSGRFIGGCYKRFMDLGEVYTSRGCRLGNWPLGDSHFANHRMVRLEILLKGKKEGCLSSPHASLTPFSRAISLYTRYHVCICQGRYCNKANFTKTSVLLLFAALLFIALL